MLTLKKNITRLSRLLSRVSAQRFFLGFAVPVGLCLAFLTPPFQVPDEQAHFFRAYQVSEGDFIATRIPQGAGGVLPMSLLHSAHVLIGDLPTRPEVKFDTALLWSQLKVPMNHENRGNVHFENTALYAPLLYAPSAIGIRLADSLFSAPPVALLYIGRLCNLAVWISLVYMALRLTTVARWGFAVVALAPMSLFQAASMSADAITMGLSFVAIAWFVRLSTSQTPLTKSEWVITGVLALCLGFIKLPYALLAGLFVLVPTSRFSSLKHQLVYGASVLLPFIVGLVIWLGIAQQLYVQSPFLTDRVIEPSAQLQHIVHHPLSFMRTLLHTHTSPYSDALIRQFVGVFGWLDTDLPLWTVLVYGACLLLAFYAEKDSVKLASWQRWMAGITYLAFVVAIDILVYMSWDKVGFGVITGLQGRYYLALAPLLALVAAGGGRYVFAKYNVQAALLVGLGVTSTMSLFVIFLRFY